MAYSDFTLDKVTKNFDLTIVEAVDMFSTTPELAVSDFLTETLRDNLPLALASNTEKARSEMIIYPILIELRKQLNYQISLFSGVEFTSEPALGLNGICDFIISNSPELLLIKAPVVTIVEAKKENLNGGLGQCIAEMLSAKLFNEREGNPISSIYGVVTSGTNWRFLKLTDKIINIDLSEYYLRDVNKILGILANSIAESRPAQLS